MKNILLTGFEPFGDWNSNSSQLCVTELSKLEIDDCDLTTKIYPVDFRKTQLKLSEDIETQVDYAIHLGQIDTSNKINLESIGLNVGKNDQNNEKEIINLIDGGPLALQSSAPLERWKNKIFNQNIPVEVSFHAGTYLCNALLYWSLYYCKKYRVKTKSTFVHIPITPPQILGNKDLSLGLDLEKSVKAVKCIIEDICTGASREI